METDIQTQHMVCCSQLSLSVAEPQIFTVAVLANLSAFYWQGDIATAFCKCGLAKDMLHVDMSSLSPICIAVFVYKQSSFYLLYILCVSRGYLWCGQGGHLLDRTPFG